MKLEDFTLGELERHNKLGEEAGEVLKAMMKMHNHGKHTEAEGIVYDNIGDFTDEIGDFLAAVEKMINHGDIDYVRLMQRVAKKGATITKFLKHQNSEPVYNYSLTLRSAASLKLD
jgi:hypothetical protein